MTTFTRPVNLAPARVRILVTAAVLDSDWSDWQEACRGSAAAARIALQRVAPTHARGPHAVGIGYAETLRWFGPIDDTQKRRWVIRYVDAILEGHDIVSQDAAPGASTPPDHPLRGFELGSHAAALPDASAASGTVTEGVILLSHAETDLLALERARVELPALFPPVAGHSLVGLAHAGELQALIGPRRSRNLFVIARIHGAVASVPGLAALVGLAHAEGWCLAVISGVGVAADLLPRTSDVTADLAANLTSYFMAGGKDNVAQALRRIAAAHLGSAVPFLPPRAMPAHGLYHPDLLITNVEEWNLHRAAGTPTVIVVFYRAHVLSGNLEFVDAMLRALESRGLSAIGVFTSSLRDRDQETVPLALRLLGEAPDVIVNTVSFPVFTLSSLQRAPDEDHGAFERVGAPLLQAICCSSPRMAWSASARGLSPTEAAINVALPECDGRLITVPISFKEHHRYAPDAERIERVADIARRMTVLRKKANAQKRIAVVLSNAGGKAQRIGGAVGLDTPASLLKFLIDLRAAGYAVGELPESPSALMAQLMTRGCYDERHPVDERVAWRISRVRYASWFERQADGFKRAVRDTWGKPTALGPVSAPPVWNSSKQAVRRSPRLERNEPYSDEHDYLFSGLQFGNVSVAIQPPRGFGMDPDAMYHAPDLAPCHHYAAFHRWLTEVANVDAIVHFGTHGTLEWLPGKSLAMSAQCAPDVLLGDLPLVYPFVINNPGEGAQAKRRTRAVIIDHLVPPLTHADSYGPLSTLARLVEEYYRAEVLDTHKLPVLRRQIWELVRTARLEEDLKQIRSERHGDHQHVWDERTGEQGVPRALERLTGRGFAHLLEDLDAYLCDLGRAQIRGGLHVFGTPPDASALVDLLFAILRSPNGDVPSLVDAVTRACGIDPDVLRDSRGVWLHALPPLLTADAAVAATAGQIRTSIDDLGRALLRGLAARGFAGGAIGDVLHNLFAPHEELRDPTFVDLGQVLRFVCDRLAPDLARTTDETRYLLTALNGGYVPAGASGSPSRGMAHVLPTGRNFYTVDPRGLPTPAAYATGTALARAVVTRHFTERGRWPESIALSIWGTPTMRTGGDDLAQALALLGVRPVWEPETRRTSGLEIVPLAELGRPRVDVTLRVSGFFRDAFPALMQLFDEAVQRVVALDEPDDDNFPRKHWLAETSALLAQGADSDAARRRASYRVFSSKPGGYGTGLMEIMDVGAWTDRDALAEAVLIGSGWAYSPRSSDGVAAVDAFRRKLEGIDLVVQNLDNHEQDIFDSTDYFEFQGGLIAAVAANAQTAPQAYVGDSSDPRHPAVRTLQGEALRVYRSRVVNPKWLDAIRRHGFRGGLEMAATVDALFGFSATAGIVTNWMFEGIADSYADGASCEFLQKENPWALNAIVERLLEAEQRELWTPQPATLARLRAAFLAREAAFEADVARAL